MLNRFTTICENDPRILAAVLCGSHARGAADAWSDLDLGVVIDDAAYDEFVAGREAFVRQLGEPLFIEDFGLEGIVFFILADGEEGEMTLSRAGDFTEPFGAWRPLLDKRDILAKAKPRPQPDVDEQNELLRRQIIWFWHDLSHFITAVGRGQLWWASGQLETLRRVCLTLARLSHDFNDAVAGDDPHFKVDKALPAGALATLRPTFVPLEREAMLTAARSIIAFYREQATPLAAAHGLRYPVELERLMLERMDRLTADKGATE